MYNRRISLALFGVALACAGCGGKTPDQIEADKQRAADAFERQSAAAERARAAEEERLVREHLAAHDRAEKLDDQRAAERAARAESQERARLLELVRASVHEPDSAQFGEIRWNARKDALCGEITATGADGKPDSPRAFVVSGDAALVDSADAGEHERFGAAAAQFECVPRADDG